MIRVVMIVDLYRVITTSFEYGLHCMFVALQTSFQKKLSNIVRAKGTACRKEFGCPCGRWPYAAAVVSRFCDRDYQAFVISSQPASHTSPPTRWPQYVRLQFHGRSKPG